MNDVVGGAITAAVVTATEMTQTEITEIRRATLASLQIKREGDQL